MDCESCGIDFKVMEKLNCSVCEKVICDGYCASACATCDAIVCREHSVGCPDNYSSGCLYVVCHNCATEAKGWGHPECCPQGGFVCPPCKEAHTFVTCTACFEDVCALKQDWCEQGHHFCDPCFDTHVRCLATKAENGEIQIVCFCRWCLKGDRHDLCDPCLSCAQEHTLLMACSGCDEPICTHIAEYCGKGHAFCDTCSYNMIVSLTKTYLVWKKYALKPDKEQFVYKVCHLCLRK